MILAKKSWKLFKATYTYCLLAPLICGDLEGAPEVEVKVEVETGANATRWMEALQETGRCDR